MKKKILKFILKPLKSILLNPKVRYANDFKGLELNPREKMLKLAMQYAVASKLDGDYLEFGVYKGDTFSAAYHLAQFNGPKNMRFLAFDSFSGLPEIKGVDNEFKQYSQGQYAYGVKNFKNNILKRGVDLNKVEIIPGWFDQSLNNESVEKIKLVSAAIIWVDCDLYESALPVLDFIKEFLQDGAVIIFDDWFCFRGHPERGERRAFREWIEKNSEFTVSEYQKFGWHGNSFLVHKK